MMILAQLTDLDGSWVSACGQLAAFVVVTAFFLRHLSSKDKQAAEVDERRDAASERMAGTCHAAQADLYQRQERLQKETNAVLGDVAQAMVQRPKCEIMGGCQFHDGGN